MPPSQYTTKILNPLTWGGAIELGILASHFQTEIASIDVETGRIDHFSPHNTGGMRCVVIYSGIHYDAATLAPMPDAPSEWHQTVFPVVGVFINLFQI
jgi:ubiquitin thioesterase OTU1